MHIMKSPLLILLMSIVMYSAVNAQTEGKVEETVIVIETTLGDIHLNLYNDTPLHRDNMIKLIKDSYYDQQVFHRVIKDFMIQGGDPHSVDAPKGQRLGTGGPGYTIPAEINEKRYHKKGALAAARKGDNVNPERESSGSQFYIVQGKVFSQEQLESVRQWNGVKSYTDEQIETYTTIGGTPHLDAQYTVFGEVIKGLEVVDKIAAAETDTYDRPLNDITYTIKIK